MFPSITAIISCRCLRKEQQTFSSCPYHSGAETTSFVTTVSPLALLFIRIYFTTELSVLPSSLPTKAGQLHPTANELASLNLPFVLLEINNAHHVGRDRSFGAQLSQYVLAHNASRRSGQVLMSRAGPFTVEVAEILKIRNPNKNPVAFKVCGHVCLAGVLSNTSNRKIGQNYCAETVRRCDPSTSLIES